MGTMREIRGAVRRLGRTPGFTAVALVTLALGIGATTLIYTVVDRVALRPLPYEDADRLVSVWPEHWMSRGDLGIMQREARTLAQVGGYQTTPGFNLEVDGQAVRVSASRVSPDLLDLLGVRPVAGRPFTPDASRTALSKVAMISHGLWVDLFGGDRSAVGRSIRLDGVPHEVVGVLPAGHSVPSPGDDVLVPVVMDPENAGELWGFGGYQGVGKLAAGASAADATAELRQLAEVMRTSNVAWTPREDFRDESRVVGLQEAIVGDVRPTLLILLGAVGLVLLVVCANVANLLLTRGVGRAREAAVRAALGAGRGRLLREHLMESLLLAGGGCLLAVVAAQVGLEAIRPWIASELPRAGELALDGRILLVAVALALGTGTVAGIFPALRASSVDPARTLREGGRTAGSGGSRRRLSSLLVVAQVAAAVVLVSSAGLLLRTVGELGAVDPGFEPEGVVTAELTLSGDRYATPASRYAFFGDFRDRLAALPGVHDVALAGPSIPFDPMDTQVALFMDEVTDDPNDLPVYDSYWIRPEYLELLEIPVVRGRGFIEADGPDAPLVALVDETAADRFWPDGDPIGERVRYPWSGAPWMTVVGVVGAVADDRLEAAPTPSIYMPVTQRDDMTVTALLRAEAGPSTAAAVREVVRGMDPSVPVASVIPYDRLLRGAHARTRITTLLLAAFAVVALLLGCLGVYGVAAYSVRERTRELGVRIALGADRGRIRARVLGQGLRLALPGAVLGFLLAVPAGRLLESFLYAVEPTDAINLLAVALTVAASALLALYLPARRATRVDPNTVLRE